MKAACISSVIIIIEGENEHLCVTVIFPSSKDILLCKVPVEAARKPRLYKFSMATGSQQQAACARVSDKWRKWR